MLARHMGLAVRVYIDMERHGVAADRAIFHVVLVGAPGDIDWHDDLFAAGVAERDSLKMGGRSSAAACGALLGHGTPQWRPSSCAGWSMSRCRVQCWF